MMSLIKFHQVFFISLIKLNQVFFLINQIYQDIEYDLWCILLGFDNNLVADLAANLAADFHNRLWGITRFLT